MEYLGGDEPRAQANGAADGGPERGCRAGRALIYTSFSAASPALTPSQLVREAQPGRSYQLTGTVVGGSVHREGGSLDFSVEDRAGSTAVPVAYTGTVPDPFREGREVIVTVQKQGGSYVGERNSLITKCPSKYKVAPPSGKQSY